MRNRAYQRVGNQQCPLTLQAERGCHSSNTFLFP